MTMALAIVGATERRHFFWRDGWETLLVFFLVLTWWNVVVRVIHAEALHGDTQFWLTRPYRRGSLLGANVCRSGYASTYRCYLSPRLSAHRYAALRVQPSTRDVRRLTHGSCAAGEEPAIRYQ
jgi:hypothetical protein